MQVKLNFVGMFACFLLYFLTCLLKKYHHVWFDKWKKLFKIQGESLENQKVAIVWNLIGLYAVIFISFSVFLHRFLFFISIRMFHNSRFFFEFGICILCFLFGILFSNGKKCFHYIVQDDFSFFKSFALICMFLFLLRIYQHCISPVVLFFSVLYSICIIHYFMNFQKEKDTMHTLEFIFQFLWILVIQFTNSFILIYCLWNL